MAREILEEKIVNSHRIVKHRCTHCGVVGWSKRHYIETTVSDCQCRMAQRRVGYVRNGWKVLENTGDLRWNRAPIWWVVCESCGDRRDLTWTQMMKISCSCKKQPTTSKMAKRVGEQYHTRKIIGYSQETGKYKSCCTNCGAIQWQELNAMKKARCKCSAPRNGWQEGAIQFGRVGKERSL